MCEKKEEEKNREKLKEFINEQLIIIRKSPKQAFIRNIIMHKTNDINSWKKDYTENYRTGHA